MWGVARRRRRRRSPWMDNSMPHTEAVTGTTGSGMAREMKGAFGRSVG